MNPFDELKKSFLQLQKAVDTSFEVARVALDLGAAMVAENERLRAQVTRLELDRAAIGAFGFKPPLGLS